jgi:hypothetical protein
LSLDALLFLKDALERCRGRPLGAGRPRPLVRLAA